MIITRNQALIGTHCLIIIPTDRSTYFFSLFQRSKMKWLLSLALRNGSHDAGPFDCWICQRKGQSFPWEDLVLWPSLEIFQEFFKKFTSRCLSLQYWINYPYYIYFSVHKLQAICILWWFQFKLTNFFSINSVWYFFFGMIPHTPHVPHNIFIFYSSYTPCFAGIYSFSQVPLKLRSPWFRGCPINK